MTELVLLPHEIAAAYMAGTGQKLRAVQLGRSHRHGLQTGEGFDLADWRAHVNARGAEIAVARVTDRYWEDSPAPDYDGDVGSRQPKIHVRHTTRHSGRLILRPNDPDEGVFVLVTGSIPTFRVVGWITASEGKAGELHDAGNGRPPCWWVAQASLRPIEELRQPLTAAQPPVEQLDLDKWCTVCGEPKTAGVCPNADNSAHREAAA